jgi:ABC-type branched-subunit amino acid transport system ATPase component
VTFGYPASVRPVLEQVSFTAGPGRMLAITGPSGAGKSTIARLLTRFGDPDAGRVRLDGIDIRELSLRTLRYNVTLLQQEALLFPGTVADNIGYGRTGATGAEVAAAARRRTRTRSSPRCRTATTPWSASAAGCSPAASASGSAWPGPSCGTRPPWSSTSRRPAWTKPARSACST